MFDTEWVISKCWLLVKLVNIEYFKMISQFILNFKLIFLCISHLYLFGDMSFYILAHFSVPFNCFCCFLRAFINKGINLIQTILSSYILKKNLWWSSFVFLWKVYKMHIPHQSYLDYFGTRSRNLHFNMLCRWFLCKEFTDYILKNTALEWTWYWGYW